MDIEGLEIIGGHEFHENPVWLGFVGHGYGHRTRMTG